MDCNDKKQNETLGLLEEKDIESIKFIQGAIRTQDRLTRLYPRMYNSIFAYNTLLHAKYSNTDNFVKETNDLFYVWMHHLRASHCIPHSPSGLLISLPSTVTSQYVCTSPYKVENYESNYHAKINFDVHRIPLSYLKHAIIKLGDIDFYNHA